MSSPNSKQREIELQEKLDKIGYGHMEHEAISRELLLVKLERLKKGPWYKSPELWVAIVGAIAACLAAYASCSTPKKSSPAPTTTTTRGQSQ
jgi:hypothetical protein